MKLPFRSPRRHQQRGFTLLETLLAFAIVGLVLGGSYSLSIRSATKLNTTKERYLATEFARSLLDEFIYTTAPPAGTGRYKNVWDWEISSAQVPGLRTTALDPHFAFYEVTAKITRTNSPDLDPIVLKRVAARRAQ